ncbi:MAG: hypothetical protein M0T84_05200 [Betaproteobacteria bacterium]|nr:hypothetical protein [Betaproteobacteria bacterium]
MSDTPSPKNHAYWQPVIDAKRDAERDAQFNNVVDHAWWKGTWALGFLILADIFAGGIYLSGAPLVNANWWTTITVALMIANVLWLLLGPMITAAWLTRFDKRFRA